MEANLLAPEDIASLSFQEVTTLIHTWSLWARSNQLPPDHPSTNLHQSNLWEIWLALAGRGWGKTRTGAEQVLRWVDQGYGRIHIVAPTTADTRDVCVDGESGILAVAHPSKRPIYEPSKRRLTFPNGATALLFSAEEPERLRGPQCAAAWCLAPDTLVSTQLGLIPISLIDPEIHLALLPWGLRKIHSRLLTNPEAQVYTLSLQSGTITGTADHPIFDGSKFTSLEELKCAIHVKNIKESSTIFAQETTNIRRVVEHWRGSCIRMPSGLFRTVIMFIIGMATELMIRWRISSSYHRSNICCYILNNIGAIPTPLPPKKPLPAFNVLNPSKETRTIVEQHDSVVENAWMPGEGSSLFQNNALVKFVKRLTYRLNHIKNTVLYAAMEKLTSWADQPQYTKERVLSVVPSPLPSPVYDLGVEGGVFVANNYLVHNCDEIAAWQYPQETWDQLMFGLRLGTLPQVFVSTTPKPIPLLRKLMAESKTDPDRVIISSGSTYENKANLAKPFFKQVAQYEGTRLGRQELHAELIDPRESGIITESWFKIYPNEPTLPDPKFELIIQSYDTAFTEKTLDKKSHEPDPSASSTWGIFAFTVAHRQYFKIPSHLRYGIMLLDCWTDYLKFPDLRARVKKEYDTSYYGPKGEERKADIVLIEDKGSGISLRQELQTVVPVVKYNPGRADKVQRLHVVSHIPCHGLVFLPESTRNPGKARGWADQLVDQVCTFPLVDNDDLVDTFSQALQYAKDQGWLQIDEPDEEEEYADTTRRSVNPYSR